MRIAAFDLSLTATGVAVLDGEGPPTVWTFSPKVRGHERLSSILAVVVAASDSRDLLLIEGPAFGAQGDAYHQLAGLWWLVTHGLWRVRQPVVVVPPSSVKKYATGKGTAGKDLVLAAAVRRFPDVDVNDNNAADALWMLAMGARHLGRPIDQVPQVNLAGMDGVTWPEPDHALPTQRGPHT